MSYRTSLLQARELADKIRSGDYHKASSEVREETTRGLLSRPAKPKSDQRGSERESPFVETMATYMSAIRAGKAPAVEEGMDTQALTTIEGEGSVRPMSRQDAGFEAIPGTLDDLPAAREAIADVESRGSGDYEAVGPVVKTGMYKGQRAYGRYQVMEGNIGPWTREVFGEAMTKEQFMADPKAQDKVVEHQLKKSFERFGTYDDAASVWFSGQPYDPSSKKSDGSTTVPEYVKKFRRFFVENKGTN
jgi:hypothetical protein